MGPRHIADEVAQVQPRDQGPGLLGTADVAQVGHLGLEVVGVLVGQRQVPHLLAGLGGGSADLGDEPVVVAHQPGDLVAQRHDLRAGQGGEVDHRVGRRLGAVREGVGEDQAPFGVGVHHLHGLAVAMGQDV